MINENIKQKLADGLIKLYPNIKEQDILFSFCPYRVCPVGAHIDHQKGNVTGFAIDKGITIAYIPSNNHFFEVSSRNFNGTKGESIFDITNKKNDWADYLRGTVKLLYEKYGIDRGIYALIDGSLPIGGLSSSAAVIISFMKAICKINGVYLGKDEIIKLSQEVENKYIGVNSGILDQSCEILSRKDNLLYLDISTGNYRLIPQNIKMNPYKIAIIFSGIKRTLVGSAYNTRVDELKSASYCLKALSGMEYDKYNESVLRDVSKEIYDEYKDKLPENFKKRAEHYYTEMERVEKAVKAWQEGNINEFGNISFASGDSSIHNYEAGSPELIAIHNIMKETAGIYGGRFSGAGFKGCCIAIINPDYQERIKYEITHKYLKLFPEYKDIFNIYFCDTADGCEIGEKN